MRTVQVIRRGYGYMECHRYGFDRVEEAWVVYDHRSRTVAEYDTEAEAQQRVATLNKLHGYPKLVWETV